MFIIILSFIIVLYYILYIYLFLHLSFPTLLLKAAEIEKAVSIQRAGETAAEEWLELPNGCLCCTIKTTALQAIESLLKRKSGLIDYILLETTGLADPFPIINSFWADESLECLAYLDGVVCLVDGKNFRGQVKEWRVLMQQLVLADVIVISKTDLITESIDNLTTWLKERNPLAKLITCQYGRMKDYSGLLDLRAYGAVDCSFTLNQRGYLDLMNALNLETGDTPRDHEEVRSVRLSSRKRIDRDRFERWLFNLLWTESPTHRLLRAKGLLTLQSGKQIVIQAVQDLYEITELEQTGPVDGEEGVLVLLGWFEGEEVIESIKASFYNIL